MNRYLEAIAIGLLATAVTFIAGVGSSSSSRAAALPTIAATPASSNAENRIELLPQISGRIATINFVAHQEVRKGDVLLLIDPEPYEIAFDKAQAELAKAQWRYEFAVRKRTRATNRNSSRNGSGEDLDASIAAVETAAATLEANKAALTVAKRNLDDTKVAAPISGIVGPPEVAEGSLVESRQTRLTTVVPTRQMSVAQN